MAEHLSYDGALLETAVRDLERHYSIVDHGDGWVCTFCIGGVAVLMNLKTHKMIEVVGKQKGLTTKPAAPSVEMGKDRGSLATYARNAWRCSEADTYATPHLWQKPRPI